jgi:menaquinone-dependent protoporphyrinogen oxidase
MNTSPMRVLVAYGSRYGSTAELAGWIADELRTTGLVTDLADACDVADVTDYDAVVLGAAVYAGRWQRDASRFARRHRAALNRRPVWLFSSGPLDHSAAERDLPAPEAVHRIAVRVGAQDHVTFGGRLTQDARGFVARQILSRDLGGDYRDEAAVRRFAHDVGRELLRAREAA